MIDGLIIRRGIATDQAYITSTWLKSLAHAPCYRSHPRQGFFMRNGADVDTLLDRADVSVRVAALAAQPDTILGWICYTQMPPRTLVLHYVYVRREHDGHEMRLHGIARSLLHAAMEGLQADSAIVYTYKGPNERELLVKHKADYVPLGRFLG